MKKTGLLFFAGIMAMSITACAGNPAATTEAETTEVAVEEVIPFIGAEDVDSNPFQYLYKERITTKTEKNPENGKMEFKDVTVYIPETDYLEIQRNQAGSETLGVTFNAALNPYLSDVEDYTLQENLERYVKDEFQNEYRIEKMDDLEIGEVIVSEDGTLASSKVSYYKYDIYDKTYGYYENYLNLREMENGLLLMTNTGINSEKVTGKTPELLQELEDFYGIVFEWDSEEVKKKVEEYATIAEANAPDFTIGNLSFDLPDGWEDVEDGYYAPGGDPELSGGVLQVQEEYIGEGITRNMNKELLGSEEMKNMVASMLGMEGSSDFSMETADSKLGVAFRIGTTLTQADSSAEVTAYLIYGEDGYLYAMTAIAMSGYDGEEVIIEGLEKMFTTAVLR